MNYINNYNKLRRLNGSGVTGSGSGKTRIYHEREEFSNFREFKRKLSARKFFGASSALRFGIQINARVEKHVLDATDDKYGSAVTAGRSVERSESH